MGTVTKADLVRMLVHELGCTRPQALQAVNALVEGLVDAIIRGERIEIRGFGSWTVKAARHRIARNPKTGERLFLSARRKVRFKPGRMLKDALSRPLKGEGQQEQVGSAEQRTG